MRLHAEGSAEAIRRQLDALCAEIPPAPQVRLQLLDYQLAALFVLARRFNRPGARILEIGTGHGGSGHVLGKAAPLGKVVSLTTSFAEKGASEALWRSGGCSNVVACVVASWDFLERTKGDRHFHELDMVFVDGDHNRIARDLPWFNRLREGGLLLCHDYSPQDSRSPSGIVYAQLNAMAARLGRPFDVRIVDEGRVGMAGFYRQPGETL